jgi:LPS-assembly lipoprotein
MSSARRGARQGARRRARDAVLGLMLGGLALLATGCGFEPMYGENRGDVVRTELQAVRVGAIPNRTGQLLRRYILDRIHNGDESPPALYQLEVGVVETRQFFGIQRDLSATYARFVITGYYTLRDLKTQKAVLGGNTSAYSSYNIAADPFNSVVAEGDARDRAVRTLGDDLITRVSLYLRNPTPPTPDKTG